MRITFHGAVRTVTGSQHLLTVNGSQILLDCGLYQGHREESYARNLHFPFNPETIDKVVLSHAHIDHSGNLPNLVKQGFKGDIICTEATRDLAAAMLSDSGFIQERDVEYLNKQPRKRGQPALTPIYTHRDAITALSYFTTQSYHRRHQIAPDVYLTFYEAGHLLGSAIVQLEIADADTGKQLTFIFSGDLGRKGLPIIRDPEFVDGADILLLESTYGDRLHESYAESAKRLEQIVNETYRRGGSIVMPAFAIGRTQQLVITLRELAEKGDIPHIPIFVDSPLAVDATSIFRLHPECYDAEMQIFMTGNPFGFNDLTYIRQIEDSKRLNFMREPHIIISSSGMAEFGRVLHHLKNRVSDSRNTILITGWQAPDTLGRRIVEKQASLRILDEECPLRAQVEVIDGFSGHADRDELVDWVRQMQKQPQQTFLVHGEEDSMFAFKQTLETTLGLHVTVPQLGQTFEV
jgi:metallo-beta-lactamase family protein